jgi:acyl-coenzyme A thioesterase PaaI-like protein
MSPRDIRELKHDQAAYAAELERRWSGLLSYRYIGRRFGSMDAGEGIDATVRVRRDFRNTTGGLLVAPLAIASPEGGGMTDLEAVPNPVIHSIQLLDPGYDVARLEVVSVQLKAGRQMSYSRSLIVDADGRSRVIAFTEGQGASIGEVPAGLAKMPETRLEIEDSPDLPPLWRVFGAAKRADGHWTLPPLAEELASPDAALHIGPQHILLETSASDAAHELAGTDRLQVESAHVMFLARGKTGPFRADAEAWRGAGGRIGVRTLLVDEGGGRTITSASHVFRHVPASDARASRAWTSP